MFSIVYNQGRLLSQIGICIGKYLCYALSVSEFENVEVLVPSRCENLERTQSWFEGRNLFEHGHVCERETETETGR